MRIDNEKLRQENEEQFIIEGQIREVHVNIKIFQVRSIEFLFVIE